MVGVGDATKKLERFVQGDKTYLAGITLGATSTTDDAEGELTEQGVGAPPNEEMIGPMLQKFVGTQEQLPPVYSAIKTGGKKAYAEARAGREVERKPRLVTIHELETVGYQYPRLMVRVMVSKGTYVRALARDIGEALGTGGYLSALRRERVGAYSVEQAHTLAELEHGWEQFLIE